MERTHCRNQISPASANAKSNCRIVDPVHSNQIILRGLDRKFVAIPGRQFHHVVGFEGSLSHNRCNVPIMSLRTDTIPAWQQGW